MRIALSATILLAASVGRALSSESLHLPFECSDVDETAKAYLSKNGILTTEKTRFQDISIIGRESEPRTAERPWGGKLKPWTDAQGSEITDFKVYWTYADRRTGEKL